MRALLLLLIQPALVAAGYNVEYVLNPSKPSSWPGNCDPIYASVCGVQKALLAMETATADACPGLNFHGIDQARVDAQIDAIQNGDYNSEGLEYGLMLIRDATSKIIDADSIRADLVGQALDSLEATDSRVVQTDFTRMLQVVSDGDSGDVDDKGGKWIPRFATRVGYVKFPPIDTTTVRDTLVYVKRCPDDANPSSPYLLAVEVGRENIPAILGAKNTVTSYASIQNVRRLVGFNLVDLLAAESASSFERVLRATTYSDKYMVLTGYYVFIYKYGDDSNGVPTHHHNVAHPMSPTLIRNNISSWRRNAGAAEALILQGTELTLDFAEAGRTGGDWVHYLYGPLDALYYKTSLTVGVAVTDASGVKTNYFLGSGYTHEREGDITQSTNCGLCPVTSSMPCAPANAAQLAIHGFAVMLLPGTASELFDKVTTEAEYQAPALEGGSEKFYVQAFRYDGDMACTADGLSATNVGKTWTELVSEITGLDATVDGANLHDDLMAAADAGGGWISHQWGAIENGALVTFSRAVYVIKLSKERTSYYILSGFRDVTVQGVTLNSNHPDTFASTKYADDMAEHNVLAVMGAAQMMIFLANTQEKVYEVSALLANASHLVTSNGQTHEDYVTHGLVVPSGAEGDDQWNYAFKAYVYTQDWTCPDGVDASACPPPLADSRKQALNGVGKRGWVTAEGERTYVLEVPHRLPGSDLPLIFKMISTVQDDNAYACSADGDCPANADCSPTSFRCKCNTPAFMASWDSSAEEGEECEDDFAQRVLICNSVEVCAAGTFKPAGESECRKTQIGYYQPNEGEDFEMACAAGAYCPDDGTGFGGCENCVSCGAGSAQALTGQGGCELCERGTATSESGSSHCIDCPPGSYASGTGASQCSACPIDQVQTEKAAISCSACPETRVTTEKGAYLWKMCLCKAGHFESTNATITNATNDYPEASSMSECLPCNEEALSCPVGSTAYHALGEDHILPGYEVEDPVTKVVGPTYAKNMKVNMGFYLDDLYDDDGEYDFDGHIYSCHPLGANALSIGDDYISPCAGETSGWAGCADGREGLACGRCQQGRYQSVDGSCQQCEGGDGWLFIVFCIVIPLMAIYAYYFINSSMTADVAPHIVVCISFGTFLATMQSCAALSAVSVTWPAGLKGLWFFAQIFAFDTRMLKSECMVGTEATTSFVAKVFMPYCLAGMLLVLSALSSLHAKSAGAKSWHMRFDKTLNTIGSFYQAAFITIVLVAVDPFRTYGHPGTGDRRSIASAPDVLTSDSRYSAFIAGAIIGLIPCIAFMALYFKSVRDAPNVTAGMSSREEAIEGTTASASKRDASIQFFLMSRKFIFFRFQNQRYYWGLVFLARSVGTAFTTLLDPSAPFQQTFALCAVLLVYFGTMCVYWPWKTAMINVMDAVMTGCVIMMVVAATAMVGDSISDTTRDAAYYVVVICYAIIFVLLGGATASLFFQLGASFFTTKKDTQKGTNVWKLMSTARLDEKKQRANDIVALLARVADELLQQRAEDKGKQTKGVADESRFVTWASLGLDDYELKNIETVTTLLAGGMGIDMTLPPVSSPRTPKSPKRLTLTGPAKGTAIRNTVESVGMVIESNATIDKSSVVDV